MNFDMPLPFFADGRSVKYWDHGRTYAIARIDPGNRYLPEARPEFAQYIAHTANCCPDLLEACKQMLAIWYRVEGCPDPDCLVCRDNRRVKSLIEAAIAKAEGK